MSPSSGWRVIDLEVGVASDLLGRSVELLDALADDPVPVLRWYLSPTPAIILGRGQATPPNLGELPVVGRFSGGGAVLMDTDLLSADVIVPAGHPWMDDDLGVVFDHVGAAWHAALSDLGVEDLAVARSSRPASRRGDERERLRAAICYATLGRGEVHAGGRKLVGLSQRRRRHGALVQCGILRRWRPAPLLAALGADPDDPEITAAAVGLADLTATPPDDAAVMRAVTATITAP